MNVNERTDIAFDDLLVRAVGFVEFLERHRLRFEALSRRRSRAAATLGVRVECDVFLNTEPTSMTQEIEIEYIIEALRECIARSPRLIEQSLEL